mgnify:FL=1
MLLDIHSHILPAVDDGAFDISESLMLLEAMRLQGITDVIATPHFYPLDDNFNEYKERISNAYNLLLKETENKNLPRIFVGSEVLYYRYIGTSETVYELCLNRSQYLLLELTDECICKEFFDDIDNLVNKQRIIPIIAHLERYRNARNYKKLLKYIKENGILAQINASSLFSQSSRRATERLIKGGLVNFIATDAHSMKSRPPMMKPALEYISENIGAEYAGGFIRNSQILLEKITGDNI